MIVFSTTTVLIVRTNGQIVKLEIKTMDMIYDCEWVLVLILMNIQTNDVYLWQW